MLMVAKQLFDNGDLQGAIRQLTADVKATPLELRNRIFLFELLCFAAEFERAGRQLDAVAQVSGDAGVQLGTELYRQILKAETTRRDILQGESRQPRFLLEPPSYTALHLQALDTLKHGRHKELENLLDDSRRHRKDLHGEVESVPFDDFRDGDDLLAPFLELIVQADYVWLPLEQIVRIEIAPPRTLRDLLWIPARVEVEKQQTSECFIPVRYHGSGAHPEDSVKLGRMTVWDPVGEETNLGKGQHMFLIDGNERSLLEIRRVEFASS
jgi:type VI secretion system protein ImpE